MPIAKDHTERWRQLARLGQMKRAQVVAFNIFASLFAECCGVEE